MTECEMISTAGPLSLDNDNCDLPDEASEDHKCVYKDEGDCSSPEDLERPPIPGREVPHTWSDDDLDMDVKATTASSSSSVPAPPSPGLCPLRWSHSMTNLLQDSEGVALFKNFLETQGRANILDFYFACQGFKHKVDAADSAKIYQLIKAIVRTYIRGSGGGATESSCGASTSPGSQLVVSDLSSSTRRAIIDRLTHKVGLDQTIFDEAQNEVEVAMCSSSYPEFLQSSIYRDYIVACGLDKKELSSVPCHNNNHITSHKSDNQTTLSCTLTTCTAAAPLTTENLMVSCRYRKGLSCGGKHGSGKHDSRCHTTAGDLHRPLNPYHISYAPVSAQDSEFHSSDAQTDDTFSHTDSSLDGGVGLSRKFWKPSVPPALPKVSSSRRTSRRTSTGLHHKSSSQNNPMMACVPSHLINPTFLHHQRMRQHAATSKERNLAEVDPKSFANRLIECLNRAKMNHLHRTNKEQFEEDPSGIASAPAGSSGAAVPLLELSDPSQDSALTGGLGPCVLQQPWAGRLMAAAQATGWPARPDRGSSGARGVTVGGPLEEDPESILEEHCSRVWDRSPGDHRQRLSEGRASSAGHNPSGRGVGSTTSFDSGVTADFYSEHRHVHHYHYYLANMKTAASAAGNNPLPTSVSGSNPTATPQHRPNLPLPPVPSSAEMNSSVDVSSSTVNPPSGFHPPVQTSDCSLKAGEVTSVVYKASKTRSRASDTSSNIDSGVSMLYDRLNPSSSDKVLHWIMENDSSASPTSGAPLPPCHHSCHPQSQGGLQQWVAQQASVMAAATDQPRQPCHHLMPPLPPPDPTTQLEEAKRRLLASENQFQQHSSSSAANSNQSASNKMAKSKSFPVQAPPDVSSSSGAFPSNKLIPGNLVSNCSTLNNSRSDLPPTMSFPAAGSTTSQEPGLGMNPQDPGLIVGYYLCGDPVPYRSFWPYKEMTLGQFKQHIAKKGNYRFFFKKACDEFDTGGVVHEEFISDDAILPLWEGKVVAKVERVD